MARKRRVETMSAATPPAITAMLITQEQEKKTVSVKQDDVEMKTDLRLIPLSTVSEPGTALVEAKGSAVPAGSTGRSKIIFPYDVSIPVVSTTSLSVHKTPDSTSPPKWEGDEEAQRVSLSTASD